MADTARGDRIHLTSPLRKLKQWLPKGLSLPEEDWNRRHRSITVLLFAMALGLFIFGLTRGFGVLHVGAEALIPAYAATLANLPRSSRRFRASLATFGLVAVAGIFVHQTGGMIEAHFLFFVVLAVISLYQDWWTFALAIAFVALHHGVMGALSPESVYNHADAIANPWKWALIHAGFVLAEAVALIAGWRFTEAAHERAADSQQQLLAEKQRRLEEKVAAQEILLRRDAQLREAQQIAKLGSWEVELSTNEMSASEELVTLLGLDPGMSSSTLDQYMALVHPADRPAMDVALARAVATRQPFEIEIRAVKPGDKIAHLFISGKAVGDSKGEPERLVGTTQDVTDRKLLEDQLHQAQKMEAVGQLAGGIAHDFNNLLGIVTNYGRFVADELGDEHPSKSDVEEIVKAGQRGAQLTRQLLSFSRKEIVAPEALNPNELIANLHGLLSRTIKENIELSLRLADDAWTIEMDPGKLEQVLMNLAINATDALPNGGALIVETDNVRIDEKSDFHPRMDPGEYVRIQVSDTGMGMPKEVQERVFEPFFTTKGIGKGTGLGLASVYGIVQQAGGSIYLYSEVGNGTTFKIYLPRSHSEYTSAVTKDPAKKPERSVNGRTILVVEDEDSVLELTSRILTQNGFDVVTASNGKQALAVLGTQRGSIDLLLTDVVMPEMSGRDLSQAAGIKTLYMSGYTNELIAQQGILADDESLVQKPFTAGELLTAVTAMLTGDDRTAAGVAAS